MKIRDENKNNITAGLQIQRSRVKISLFIITFTFTSCSYLILPKNYFNTYTENIKQKKSGNYTLNINKMYVFRDTFETKSFQESFGFKGQFKYIIFYNNSLMAEIYKPFKNNSKTYTNIDKEIIDSINAGFYDKPYNQDKINWTYFKIEENKLIKYSFDGNVSEGHNALSHVYLIERNYILYNGSLVYEDKYNQYKNTPLLETFLYNPLEISVKPDSSKSDFIKMYNKYLLTGKRRFYSYYKDREKYFNK